MTFGQNIICRITIISILQRKLRGEATEEKKEEKKKKGLHFLFIFLGQYEYKKMNYIFKKSTLKTSIVFFLWSKQNNCHINNVLKYLSKQCFC